MAETEQSAGGQRHFVGRKDELIKSGRSFRTLEGRDVLVIFHRDVFYALDSYCYHAGGKLEMGDIEDLGGRLCIICPRHKYKITLAEGEGLYKGVDKTRDPPLPKWFSKGVKQRTHQVTESDGDVYVQLSQGPGWVESDYYQGEKGKQAREKAQADEEEDS